MKNFKLFFVALSLTFTFAATTTVAQTMQPHTPHNMPIKSPYSKPPAAYINPFKQAKVCKKAGSPLMCQALAQNTIVHSINLIRKHSAQPEAATLLQDWATFLNVPHSKITFTFPNRVQNHIVNIVKNCWSGYCTVDRTTYLLLTRTQAALTKLSYTFEASASNIGAEGSAKNQKLQAKFMRQSIQATTLAKHIGIYFLGKPI